ncbi:D-glycero-beta-D-manno-heptose 1-phosphate adenylyltransferase [Fluviispira sanaruensis]|uniref:Bifunctional protein HldE n=1 Tax=Fluviispira sanaruensis TaxID=2493639 RepID=A0A4P2VHE9_FLUSA|nr:D-glycero-beta-D-manno-heptose 1-phosphate adenylyltransferase [Fluviispira sanaruensis]BBH52131.1 bifunctional D-glycero-beta-D-manno-heptose-7-phosphate kinase/D-glycero-beta-D-manno-heptose 1-phosphate adenylyltransferase HldE [Fluviispira sanaruensis]
MTSLFHHTTPEDILNLKETRIFIVGDIILDTYIEGRVSRISPEAPVPVVLESKRRAVPGGAANVAANITSMGARAVLCGRIGNDAEAIVIKNVLEEHNIDTSALIVSKHIPTTTKMRIMSGNSSSGAQQIVRVDKESNEMISCAEEEKVLELYENFIENNQNICLILSDYGKGFLTKNLITRLIAVSNAKKIPIVTDPKSEDVGRYENSTVIKPNLSEGKSVYKVQNPGVYNKSFEEEVDAIADCYLKASGCKNLVMSLSEHGIMTRGQDIEGTYRIASHALQVSDVSGAGDTLIAFIAMCLAAQFPLIRATELGNIAAGIVCGKLGTSTLSPSEFLSVFKDKSEATHPEKRLDINLLTLLAKDLKSQKRRSVFTNGCFDILHAGHVEYLQKARSLGDLLIVGLNSDKSVQRLKGSSRPVQSENDRAKILASLACIDYVVIFDEDTPLEIILAIKPDVLVKGADYNFENTVGAKEVISWGGCVEHIALVPGRSTTSILQKAQLE